LKRWIRFYDEKTNRMDVARCLADSNIVSGDLLHILATWPEADNDVRFKARIALACFEVLVPLTWPIERDLEKMTINHHRHLPVLQSAQLGYKRAIINFDGAMILRTAVRVALPSMAMPIGERTPRDQGIIKLVLFFLRNIAMIAPQPGMKLDSSEDMQMSRDTLIDAFSYQDIFLTILTLASNMGEDFRTEDVVLMEIIFHLVKRVDVHKLFLTEKDLHKEKANELGAVMAKEAAMLRAYKRTAPTRHSRFGTMIWVQRENGKLVTLSGQDALRDAASREAKLDSTKTFKPPRRHRRDDMEPKDLGPPVSLNSRANEQLREFVEEFLDSGFNPLFQHVRKTIDREAPHLQHHHRAQFFYLVAWFLEAERARQRAKKAKGVSQATPDDVRSFNLVAGVLNQEMFIALSRALDRAYTEKDWPELTTVMRCFTQILLTVQEMADSGNEDDEEIADNILNRLFYEEATHDAVANIVRTYKDQGFEYLDACTELTHTYLRILESYSKQNVDMHVRSRKARRRKKKRTANAAATGLDGKADDSTVVPDDVDSDGSGADDAQAAERTSRERKFDFKRFGQRFVPQGVVDTFVKFTKYYHDLNSEQLKRAHRYFHRIAFKQEMSVMLFRVDILHLFLNMVKGNDALDKSNSMFKEWEELARQVIKRCIKKLEERPALITELLFSKINATAFYLEYGHEKQTISSHPRPGAELEFKKSVELDQQIAITVGVLLDKGQAELIDWLKKQLVTAETERRAWEAVEAANVASIESLQAEEAMAAEQPMKTAEAASKFFHTRYCSSSVIETDIPVAIKPDDAARRTAMFKNSHLRLLMKLVGIERLAPSLEETPESVWILPSHVTADQLKESLDLIQKAEFSPPVFEEGELAENQLRRKSAARKRADFDDDGDDVDDFLADDETLFPADGPGPRDAAKAGKKRTIRRRRHNSDDEDEDGPTEEELKARARARRLRELEKARKIKSEMYVHESDDEDWDEDRDREFFAREEEIRRKVDMAISDGTAVAVDGKPKPKPRRKALLSNDESDAEPATKPTKKRRSSLISIGSDGNDSDSDEASPPRSKKQRKPVRAETDDEEEEEPHISSTQTSQTVDDDSEDGMQTDDTPLSSSPRIQAGAELLEDAQVLGEKAGGAMDEDDEDDVPVAVKARARVRAGFVLDDSDDE
jgi:replication fork protection complex subunit Tof1/Swi1